MNYSQAIEELKAVDDSHVNALAREMLKSMQHRLIMMINEVVIHHLKYEFTELPSDPDEAKAEVISEWNASWEEHYMWTFQYYLTNGDFFKELLGDLLFNMPHVDVYGALIESGLADRIDEIIQDEHREWFYDLINGPFTTVDEVVDAVRKHVEWIKKIDSQQSKS